MPSFNKSPLAFDDCKELFDRALASPKGISVLCKSHRHAMITRTRLNTFRAKDRKVNEQIYPPEHPMYGNSSWDRLVCRIPRRGTPNDNTVFIEKRTLDDFVVTDLADQWKPTDVGLLGDDDIEPIDPGDLKPDH